MADLHTAPPATTARPSASKLRSLARTGFDAKTFLKNITAVEIAAMVGLVILTVSVIVIYFFLILPDQVRRINLSNEVVANRTKVEELRTQAGDPASLTRAYQEVHESLDSFRGQTLQPRTAGRLQIINLVNDLTRQTNVTLTAPISFEARNPQTDDVVDEDGTSKRKSRKSEDEIRTYPSLSMAVTISGGYPDIRRFLAKFETSRQFAIIESVSISADEEEDEQGGGRRGAGSDGSGAITLDISMTAYFQPAGSTTATVVGVSAEPRTEQR